jgi:hypothetical protein
MIIPLAYGRKNHPFSDVCRQQKAPLQNLNRTLLHERMTAKTRLKEVNLNSLGGLI